MMSAIESLPLDVHLQLFAFTQPHDMLNLALTSKHTYKLLRSQAVHAAWRSAFQEMDAYNDTPPYPQWIPGLQLAGLLYGSTCLLCGVTSDNTVVLFAIIKRVCASCSRSSPFFVRDSKVKTMLKPDSKLALMIRSMLNEIHPRPGATMEANHRSKTRNETVRYLPEVSNVITLMRSAKSVSDELFTKLRAEMSTEVARRYKLEQRWHAWLEKERGRKQLDFAIQAAKHSNSAAWAGHLSVFLPQPGRLTKREFGYNMTLLAAQFEQKKQAPGQTLRQRLELELDGLTRTFQSMHKGSVVIWGYQRREDIHRFFVDAEKTPDEMPTVQHIQEAHVLAARVCWTKDVQECMDDACTWTKRDVVHAKSMDASTAADMPLG